MIALAAAAWACTDPGAWVSVPPTDCLIGDDAGYGPDGVYLRLTNACDVSVEVVSQATPCDACTIDLTLQPEETVDLVFPLPMDTEETVPWRVTPEGEASVVVDVEYVGPTDWSCPTGNPLVDAAGACGCRTNQAWGASLTSWFRR